MWECIFACSVALLLLGGIAASQGLCRSNLLLYVYYSLMAFGAYHCIGVAHSPVGMMVVMTGAFSHCMVRRTDPGYVYHGDRKTGRAKVDTNLPPLKMCSQCKQHVRGFDHHCGWIASDVGAGNLWQFRVFLMAHVMVCLILSRESFVFLIDVTDRMKLWDTTYRVGLQRNVTATNFLVARYLGQHHMSHFLTMLLGTSIGFSLVVFATLHFLK